MKQLTILGALRQESQWWLVETWWVSGEGCTTNNQQENDNEKVM
jgi:hypothetical protein